MRTVAAASFLLVLAALPARAQVIGAPPRSTAGLFGGDAAVRPEETRQELALTLDFLSGYDDNLSPQGQSVATDPFSARRSGTTGSLTAALRYQRASTVRGIEATGRGFVNSISNVGVRPLVGGRGSVRLFGRFFDRTNLSATAEADRQPTFMFGTFSPGAIDGGVPPSDPTAGVTEIRSVNAIGTLAFSHEWNPRQRTTAGGTWGRSRQFGITDSVMTQQMATFGQAWDFARDAGVTGTYSVSHQGSEDATGGSRPVDTQTVTVRGELRRRISRTRRMTFAGGGGAMQVRTSNATTNAPIDYVAPSGMASVRLDLGRTWAVSADVRRDVSMLLGVTQQSFLTSTGSLWAGGNIGRRLDLSVTGSYTDGAPHAGDTGAYTSAGAITQVRYQLARCCSVLTSYSYYQHRLRDVSVLPPGYPSDFERNAVRVGMTFWLPLYGTFTSGRQQ